MRAAKRLDRPGFWSSITVLGYLIVALLLVYPLFNIFKFSFVDKTTGAFSLSNWQEFFSQPYYSGSFLNTMVVAIGGTLGAVVLGVPLALFTTRYRIYGRSLLSTVAVLALLSPPFIGAYSWIILLGRRGLLRVFLLDLGISFPSIYGPLGIILVYTLHYYPYVFLLTSGALTTVDRSLEEAAENLGAKAWRRFFRVTLPLVLPSVTAGALIAFMMCLSSFDTPMIIGGNYRVLPTLAYNLFTSEVGERPGLASTVSILLILSASAVIFLQRWVAGRRKYSSSLVNRPVVKRLRGWPAFGAHLVSYLIVAVSAIPLVVVVFFSFRNTNGPVFQPGFGLDSYLKVFREVPKTITNSLLFAGASVALIVVAGTLLGFVLARRKTVPAQVLDPLLMIPYMVPGTVIGIGFIVAFNTRPVFLLGTATIIILAYFIRRLPYSVRSGASILKQIDPVLEEAGINLGAPPARTFRKVTLPLMLPGILSGAILSWVTVINEVSASILLYVGRTMTLPIRVYLSVLDGYFGPASAMSTILLAVTGLSLYVVNRFFGLGREGLVEPGPAAGRHGRTAVKRRGKRPSTAVRIRRRPERLSPPPPAPGRPGAPGGARRHSATPPLGELELLHQLLQPLGEAGQLLGGAAHLLGRAGRLLGELVDVLDRLRDLLGVGGLLLGGRGDRLAHLGDAVARLAHLADGAHLLPQVGGQGGHHLVGLMRALDDRLHGGKRRLRDLHPRGHALSRSLISFSISLVEEEERSASFPTSSATTAKPRPCSPARAASIAALRASRLVWSAMSPITPMMPPICSEETAIAFIASTALPTASMPPWAFAIESWAEPETDSRVLETCCTLDCIWAMLLLDCSTEAAWLWACSETCSTEAVSSSTEAEVSSRVLAWLCAPSESCCALALISSLLEAIWSAPPRMRLTISRRLPAISPSARESCPISSPRPPASMRPVRSPEAMLRAKTTPATRGREMERATRNMATTMTTTPATASTASRATSCRLSCSSSPSGMLITATHFMPVRPISKGTPAETTASSRVLERRVCRNGCWPITARLYVSSELVSWSGLPTYVSCPLATTVPLAEYRWV